MEKRLFYLYMKYIKESCPSIWKRLGKISVKLKAYLWLMVIFYIGSIISLTLLKYLPDSWSISVSILSILSILACIICGILLYIATEKYEIAVSSQTMNEYWNYCFGLRDWFRENFSNRSKNDINNDLQDVKSRLDLYLKQQAEIIDKRNNRVDKWIQTLAIPFVLAIITSIEVAGGDFEREGRKSRNPHEIILVFHKKTSSFLLCRAQFSIYRC